jgi:hypothetical protein
MICKIIVGVTQCSGTFYCVYKSISASRQVTMIYPDVPGIENADAITVSNASMANMLGRASNHGRPSGLAVMNENAMNDDVTNTLDSNAGPVCNVDLSSSAINGLEAVHDEFLLELDRHVTNEDDPKRNVLDHCMAEGPWYRCRWVVITGVCDQVRLPVFASQGALTKSD